MENESKYRKKSNKSNKNSDKKAIFWYNIDKFFVYKTNKFSFIID